MLKVVTRRIHALLRVKTTILNITHSLSATPSQLDRNTPEFGIVYWMDPYSDGLILYNIHLPRANIFRLVMPSHVDG